MTIDFSGYVTRVTFSKRAGPYLLRHLTHPDGQVTCDIIDPHKLEEDTRFPVTLFSGTLEECEREFDILAEREAQKEILEATASEYGDENEYTKGQRAIYEYMLDDDYQPGDWLQLVPRSPSEQLKGMAAAAKRGEVSAEELASFVFDFLNNKVEWDCVFDN